MVDRSSNFSRFLEGIEWNSATILLIGLIFAAILIIIILLILLDKRRRASTKEEEAVQLYDEKKHKKLKRTQPGQKSAVKLFDEEGLSVPESAVKTEEGKKPTPQSRENLRSTVQLYDEKKTGRRLKTSPAQPAQLHLFDEQPQDSAGLSKQNVTVKISEPGKTDQTRKVSALPTTLELFPEDEPDGAYSIGNAQHIGKREEQQDSFGVSDVFNHDEVAQKGILAVLADGMGGLENGAESSRNVVSLMLEAFAAADIHEDIPEGLKAIVQQVNCRIYTEFNQENPQSMTGSTVVAVVIRENLFYWISVGDSRIYLFRDNKLIQLNREHNYGARLDGEVQKGIISAEEAQNDPNRAALTSYIGIADLSEMDRNLDPMQLQPGDRVVMCSDGLFSTIDEAEMVQSLFGKPQEAAQKLVDRVVQKDRKYQDNVTVIVLGYH